VGRATDTGSENIAATADIFNLPFRGSGEKLVWDAPSGVRGHLQPDAGFDVKVMNSNYLVGFLPDAPMLYRPEQLMTVIQRLDDVCHSLDF
jgi:hypothetical protein